MKVKVVPRAYLSSFIGPIPEPGKTSWWGAVMGVGLRKRRSKFFGQHFSSAKLQKLVDKSSKLHFLGILMEVAFRTLYPMHTQRYDTWSISPKRGFWPFLTQYISRVELYSPEDLV